jgi:hypothetical protein
LNSEGFRETFLRSDRVGPKKAKMAGKKEAKQKAGPSGQTEKNREETESSTERRTPQRRAGRAQPGRSCHRLSKNKGPKRAPRARRGSTERTSKKAGRLSKR